MAGTAKIDRPHALYRFFAANGDLLYIGLTMHPAGRWKAHAREKWWWLDVASIAIEHFASRPAVEAAEQAAIIAERPRYNIAHNGDAIQDDASDLAMEVLFAMAEDDRHEAVLAAESDRDGRQRTNRDLVVEAAKIGAFTMHRQLKCLTALVRDLLDALSPKQRQRLAEAAELDLTSRGERMTETERLMHAAYGAFGMFKFGATLRADRVC